jgi:hypothetical protein
VTLTFAFPVTPSTGCLNPACLIPLPLIYQAFKCLLIILKLPSLMESKLYFQPLMTSNHPFVYSPLPPTSSYHPALIAVTLFDTFSFKPTNFLAAEMIAFLDMKINKPTGLDGTALTLCVIVTFVLPAFLLTGCLTQQPPARKTLLAASPQQLLFMSPKVLH